MIIDATDLIVGRLASYAAKQALLGNKVDIVNCEKAIVSGKKVSVIKAYKERYSKGNPFKGPFLPKMPDRFVRRAIRGMLPYKQYKGKNAFKRIMCYIDVPEELENKEKISLKEAHVSKMRDVNFVTVDQITKSLGRK